MSSSLDEWQDQLERHFEMLATSRKGSGFGVFALEHGLDEVAIDEISKQLRQQLKQGLYSSRHWLLWVIYMTEHGYQYEGTEYWPSFNQATPCWDRDRHNRVKPWFNKFQQTYQGIVPTGCWADHFSIISRPITHAILPKYFQVQFCRTLYHLRHSLIGLGARARNVGDIGRRLSKNADHTPTRFQEFLQQEELTGRIVLALLDEQSIEGNEPIYPQTLERIVGDLEQVRNAGEWLRETRRYVKDRFIGIAPRPPANGKQKPGDPPSVPQDIHQYDVRAKVYLSHRGGNDWIVWAEVPSFREIASSCEDYHSFLTSTRCRLNGADDFKPGGWLLSGSRKSVLNRWPNPQKPMVQFERSNKHLENLLHTGCRFTHGPMWLYQIGQDGTAREIMGGVVRPDGRYIIVTSEEQSQLRFGMSQLKVNCADIWVYCFVVPADVSTELTEWLGEFNLQVARTIRVWPAGLPGRGWSGEGQSEWLTTESLVLGMVHDHPVDRYVLQLDDKPEEEIEVGKNGNPVFIQLPRLSEGKHNLVVKERRDEALGKVVSAPAAEGFVELRVREPEPWIPGIASHCGLIANLDPCNASLEVLWRNEVDLSVIGPPCRSVTVRIRLTDGKGAELLSKRVGGRFELPLSTEMWREKFGQFLKPEKNAWVYLEAASGELEISAEELGRIFFRFEHDIPPLRWVLNRNQSKITARLVNDTGIEESKPKISFFNMQAPTTECQLSVDAALDGWVIEQPGGLLHARQGGFEDFVVVSCKCTMSDFKDLNIDSDFSQLRNSPILSANTLRLYARWHNARLYGPLINIRWEKIMDKYLSVIYEKLCGLNWAKQEASFNKSPNPSQALETLLQSVEKKPTGFSSELLRECGQPNGSVLCKSEWFAELANKYHVCEDVELCRFAFSLAMDAHQVPDIFGYNLENLINAVRENPTVLRGARFLERAMSLAQSRKIPLHMAVSPK